MPRIHIPWSDAEDALLIEVYNSCIRIRDAADRFPLRSLGAIYRRIDTLKDLDKIQPRIDVGKTANWRAPESDESIVEECDRGTEMLARLMPCAFDDDERSSLAPRLGKAMRSVGDLAFASPMGCGTALMDACGGRYR